VTTRRPEVVARCGRQTRSGEPCKRWPITGGTVCPSHGGAARQVKRAADARDVEQRAARFVSRLEVAPVRNPLSVLAQITGEAIQLKNVLLEVVDALTAKTIRSTSAFGGEELRADLAAYERSLDRVAKFAIAMARLNLDERLVAVDEATVAMLTAIIRTIVIGLGHNPSDPHVGAVVTGALRSVKKL
jgi:hypothetical protein